MLKGLSQFLLREDDLAQVAPLRNAMLESFLIHARAMVNVFYRQKNPSFPNEVFARDYWDGQDQQIWARNYSGDPNGSATHASELIEE